MDDLGLGLLDAAFDRRTRVLEESIRGDGGDRGRALLGAFAGAVIASRAEYQARRGAVEADSDPRTRPKRERKLVRLLNRVEFLQKWAAKYRTDAFRRDLPVGLLATIDSALNAFGFGDADPLIHLANTPMYSTVDLSSLWRSELADDLKDVGAGDAFADVVVINLPALDPANMLLSPCIVHEIAHVHNDRHQTVSELLKSPEASTMADISTKLGAQRGPFLEGVYQWVDELACDLLATRLLGPSYLYAASAFLLAGVPLGGGTHPPNWMRLSFISQTLRDLGWSDYLDGTFAPLHEWLGSRSPTLPPEGPLEDLLIKGITPLEPAIRGVQRVLTDCCDPAGYKLSGPVIRQSIHNGVPPCELIDDRVFSPWEVLLGGWESALKSRGATPDALSKAVSDAPFSKFLVKSIELNRVQQIWRDEC